MIASSEFLRSRDFLDSVDDLMNLDEVVDFVDDVSTEQVDETDVEFWYETAFVPDVVSRLSGLRQEAEHVLRCAQRGEDVTCLCANLVDSSRGLLADCGRYLTQEQTAWVHQLLGGVVARLEGPVRHTTSPSRLARSYVSG